MRKTQIIAKLLTQTHSQNEFDVTIQIGGQDVNIVASNLVRHILERDYYEWSIFVKHDTLSEQFSDLLLSWHYYLNEKQANFEKIYLALTEVYDPIADYRRKETVDYKLTHETDFGKTSTMTATDYESKTEYNSTVGDDITTYDSPASLRDHTSQSRTGDDTTTLNGEMKTELSGTDTVTDTREAADNIKLIEGNNRSPQEAIKDEIALRLADDLADIVLKGFAKQYLFLLPDQEEVS